MQARQGQSFALSGPWVLGSCVHRGSFGSGFGFRVPSFVIAPRFYLTASLFYFLSDTLGDLTEGLKSSAQGTVSLSGMNDPGLAGVR